MEFNMKRVGAYTFAIGVALILVLLAAGLPADKRFEIGLQVVGGFFATLAGAAAAFLLEGQRRDQHARGAEIESINLMLLGMIDRLRMLAAIRSGAIQPRRTDEWRFISIPATSASWPSYELKYADLGRLLTRSFTPAVVSMVDAEQEFRIAKDVMERRNELHHEMQQALSDLGIKRGDPIPPNIRSQLGERLWGSLTLSTDQMINSIDRAHIKLSTAIERLSETSRNIYKGQSFFSIGEELGSTVIIDWKS